MVCIWKDPIQTFRQILYTYFQLELLNNRCTHEIKQLASHINSKRVRSDQSAFSFDKNATPTCKMCTTPDFKIYVHYELVFSCVPAHSLFPEIGVRCIFPCIIGDHFTVKSYYAFLGSNLPHPQLVCSPR